MDFWEHVKSGCFRVRGLQCLCCSFWDQFFFFEPVDGVVDLGHVLFGEVPRLFFIKLGVAKLSLCFCNVGADVLDDDGASFVRFAN